MRELPSPIVTIRSDPECRSFPRLPWVARQQQRGKGGSHGQANETQGALARGWWASSRSLTLVVAGAAIGAQGYNGPAKQVYQGGNPTCPDGLADAGSTSISSTDLQGGYTDGRISITRRGVVNGIDSFDWVIADHSVDIMAVIVKGGDGAYIYFYDSLGGSWGDNNLAPPLNNGGQAPQISHAVFCYDPKDAPNPVLSVEKSASGSSQITHSWKVDKQVKPAGAADSAYGDNTVLNLPDGGNGSVTWKVTVTHSQVQTYTVNGTITVKNDGDGRRDRRRRLRLDPGCGDRLRRQRQHGHHRAGEWLGRLQLHRHA